jgi:GT2 family glycosyltransferase
VGTERSMKILYIDADYSKRVHDAGWRILYLAEVTITHLQGGTVGRRYRWTSAPAYQSMLYFLKKHRGSWAFHVSKAFAVTAIFGRWAGRALMGRKERKHLWALLTEVASYHARV